MESQTVMMVLTKQLVELMKILMLLLCVISEIVSFLSVTVLLMELEFQVLFVVVFY